MSCRADGWFGVRAGDGDRIDSPAFTMSAGHLRLRVTMRRADRYTMRIEP